MFSIKYLFSLSQYSLFCLSPDFLFSHFFLIFFTLALVSLLYPFSFFLIGSFCFFLSPTLSPLSSLARPSLSHWFPMGASYIASAVTVGQSRWVWVVGHSLMVDRIWWWVKFCDGLILCL